MWLEPEVKIHAPEIGRAWINSPPLSTRGLRGRVVLVDFWDYSCVNCIRTLPYVREWHKNYSDKGLTVIGVHSPEFSFARNSSLVEKAVRANALEYPVVIDNEFQIWQSFANRVWPTKYLIDKDGYVRFYQLGEGGYQETEEAVRKLLREINPKVALPPVMSVVREMDKPGAFCLPVTPELYLGAGRGRLGNESGYAENEVKEYQPPRDFIPDLVYLDGPWFASKEFIAACPLEARPSRILLQCSAAEVNLVMGAAEESEAIIEVRLDGKLIDPKMAGDDVRCEGNMAAAVVKEPRMYRLVKSDTVGSRLLELSTFNPGLEAYAFTFVSCVTPKG